MLSIQEMVDKTEDQRKTIEDVMDSGHFDYTEASILKEQGKEDRSQLLETLRGVPLREFLAKSSTTGIAGAAYLIPDKIYQVMFDSAVSADICAEISIAMIPADQIPGTTLKVDIAVDDSYWPKKYSSGGSMPTETIQTVQATLDFSDSWGINFEITNDLIEDSQFDVIEMHLRNAGREMGEYATNEALTAMIAATYGDGAQNTEAASDDETLMSDWVNAYRSNIQDGYVSDTIVTPHECWLHSVMTDTTYTPYAEIWHDALIGTSNPPNLTVLGCKIIFVDVVRASALNPDGDWTECKSLMFDKDYAMLTGRKRWLRIEKYSNPIKDLAGATVTARQDSTTVYKDATCEISES